MQIPLNQLVESPLNTGKTNRTDGIEVLAANIKALGLLMPLLVQPVPDQEGTYEVIDGHRRLAALRKLRDDGTIPVDCPIECSSRGNGDALAVEMSLSANLMREALHPADEYQAFAEMRSLGESVEDIARHFGLEERHVYQRLALGSVIPEVMEAFRKDQINLDTVKAFASASEERQLSVFEHFHEMGAPLVAWRVKGALRDKAIPENSPLARFVDRSTYEEAGGTIESDLFSDEVLWTDPDLVRELAEAKTKEHVTMLLSEGWSWVEIKRGGFAEYGTWQRHVAAETFASEADEARFDELNEMISEDWSYDEHAKMKAEMAEIESRVKVTWAEGVKESSGVIIDIDRDEVFMRGYVKPGDSNERMLVTTRPPGTGPVGAEAEAKKPKDRGYPAAFLSEMNDVLTEATQAALLENYHLALAALAVSLAQAQGGDLEVRGTTFIGERTTFKMPAQIVSRTADYGKAVARLAAKGHDTVLKALVQQVALHVKQLTADSYLARLAEPRKWWKPDEAFFMRLTKNQIMKALKDGTSIPEDSYATLGKDELAKLAAKHLAKSGWLPEPMRVKGARK